jgi:hypothetical protein
VIPGTPSCNVALPSMETLLGGPNLCPLTRGNKTDRPKITPEPEERSLTGDSNKDSKVGSSHRNRPTRRLRKGQAGRIHSHLGQMRFPLGGSNTCPLVLIIPGIMRC